MAWIQVLDDLSSGGQVALAMRGARSSLLVYEPGQNRLRTFPCSVHTLLAALQGVNVHLASDSGECSLQREPETMVFILDPETQQESRIRATIARFSACLAGIIDAQVARRRASLL